MRLIAHTSYVNPTIVNKCNNAETRAQFTMQHASTKLGSVGLVWFVYDCEKRIRSERLFINPTTDCRSLLCTICTQNKIMVKILHFLYV